MKRWLMFAVMLGLIIVGLMVSQMSKIDLRDRAIAYIVVGALLLAISFLYKRERGRQNL